MALRGTDAGGTQIHLLNGAIGIPRHDAVAHFKGLVHEEHERTEEVFDGILGRQSQGQTTNAQACKDGSKRLVAQDRGYVEQGQNDNGVTRRLFRTTGASMSSILLSVFSENAVSQ